MGADIKQKTYEDAVKKVRAEKPKENYVIVKIENDYNNRLLLPQKDAVALMSALANAEQLSERYGEQKGIVELNREQITTWSMSHQEYERYKIAALLNVTPEEVKEAQLRANQPPPPPTT